MSAERLARLREEMKRHNLHAWLVPGTDAHQSEYVPQLWQRRAWISGFNGSAGDVVVTRDDAGLWTDGRYFVQAEQQLAGSGIRLMKMGDLATPDIPTYLTQQLSEGQTVGMDPRTIAHNQAVQLKKQLEQSGLKVRFMSENLVDAIWDDQPGLPDAPIRVHPLKYAGESVSDKLDRLRAAMKERHCQAHVVTMLDAIAWLFNLRGSDVAYNPVFIAYALITQDDAQLFIRPDKADDSVREHLNGLVKLADYNNFSDALSQLSAGGVRVWLDGQTTNHWIANHFKDNPVVDAPSPVIMFKAVKNKAELNGYKACHVRDGVAMVRFLHWLDHAVKEGGVTEISAQEKLEAFRRELDMYVGPSFATISSYKIHGAIIHYSATPESDIPLEEDSIYLIDSGGQFLDGTTDITRTVALGTPSDEEKERFTAVLMGHIDLMLTSFVEGTTGPALDVIARRHLWNLGLNYNHGTGHGVGAHLGVHEGPQSIKPAKGLGIPLREGMILSNEPGYYKDGAYGIRIENLVNVIKDEARSTNGFTFLTFDYATLCPIDLRCINKAMMEPKHIEWLNAYHKKVWATLSPMVEDDVRAWLEQATRSL
ncbi:MAG: aminopeptidase P family protein [Calditrichaeota bacterium]|nr:MAG: aminopeptidase P family protein [Calditrichota bacterium]